jgi:hypothetical protein
MKTGRYTGAGALLLALFLGMLFSGHAFAEDYSGAGNVPSGFAAAGLLDPSDPLSAIHCRHNCGCPRNCRDCGNCSDCGRDCAIRPRQHRDAGGRPRFVNVDCSRQRKGWSWSVSDALQHVAPNGTIYILPPGEGATCVESLAIHMPVTIATLGASGRAVIQAPEGQPCIVADIALGDRLSLQSLKIIARGHDEACVQVTAGAVEMRNADIDSRNTNWAFDVGESGALRVVDTRVETDGSGVRAARAHVSISGLGIDMSPNRTAAALQFECTDGDVDKVQIIGGRWGVLASPGAHGLWLSHVEVSKAAVGAELVAGAQGTIRAKGLWLWRNQRGLVVGPGVDAEISQSAIVRSELSAAVLFGAAARLQSNRIAYGRVGVRVGPAEAFSWADVPLKPVQIFADGDAPTLTDNRIGPVTEAGILIDHGAQPRISQNTIAVFRGGDCVVGDGARKQRRDNTCSETAWGDDGDWDVPQPSAARRAWFDPNQYPDGRRPQNAVTSSDVRQ